MNKDDQVANERLYPPVRWIKCPERMPEKPGDYLFMRIMNGDMVRSSEWWDAHPNGLPDSWVAWLENVPEYIPSTTTRKHVRWVMCEDRMPDKPGEYLFVRIMNGHVFKNSIWWHARPGRTLLRSWDAWLENVPEYVP